jgi:hypothetical protein
MIGCSLFRQQHLVFDAAAFLIAIFNLWIIKKSLDFILGLTLHQYIYFIEGLNFFDPNIKH